MRADIVGLLPMGGQGTRLGMPFPKPLAPTFTDEGIVPLYRHTLSHLLDLTDNVFALVRSNPDRSLMGAIQSEGMKSFHVQNESLAGALGEFGELIQQVVSVPDPWVAVALPDSVWKLREGCSLVSLYENVKEDGALGLFRSGADQLDNVVLDGDRVAKVITKPRGATGSVIGWGAFIVRASALARFSPDEKDGPQLGRLRLGWQLLGESEDLGTVERYMRFMDTRSWM